MKMGAYFCGWAPAFCGGARAHPTPLLATGLSSNDKHKQYKTQKCSAHGLKRETKGPVGANLVPYEETRCKFLAYYRVKYSEN